MAKKTEGMKNPTNVPEIDSILEALSKTLGEDASGDNFGNLEIASTGSLTLDMALKRGGYPKARIIEITGDTGTMKTSLALYWMGLRQKERKAAGITNKRDLILDLEHMLEADFIESLGVDLEQTIWKRFYSAEDALQYLTEIIKSGLIETIVVDSVDAMQSENQLEKVAGEDVMGGFSKILSKSIRTLTKLVAEHKTTLIFINQIRASLALYAPPTTSAGGKSIPYYSRLRLQLLKPCPHPDVPDAAKMRIKVIKTSMSVPIEEEIELAFLYGKGFDFAYDVEACAKKLEILRHSAGQTKIIWTPGGEAEPLLPDIERGKEAAQAAIRNSPELQQRIKEACFLHKGIK